MSFIQANSCFFRTESNGNGITYTPSDGFNQVDLTEELETLSQSFWSFNDPDSAKQYIAIFPSVDNFKEKIYRKIVGRLFHLDSENFKDLASSLIKHKVATMIITGESMRYKTINTYIANK